MNVLSRLAWQGLIKNRTRTIVTIVGVVLSAALLSGVTSFIVSFQDYLVRSTIANRGDWQVQFADVDADFAQKLRDDPATGQVALVQSIGYARLDGGANRYKPYLYVAGYDEQAFSKLPIDLLDGRLPQGPDEVLISQHIETDGSVNFRIGDTLNLEIGQRQYMGEILGQTNSLRIDEDGQPGESLTPVTTRTFTVVGVCARLNSEFESYIAPGYTVITVADRNGSFDAYASMATLTKEVYQYAERMADGHQYDFNYQLLRFTGVSGDSFNTVLYSLGAVLIGLIMVGSVLLIYNSFSISVAERSRQFGVLASVGATRRQLRRSVLFEGACVGAVGIPLGVVAGVVGIGITLKLVSPVFAAILYSKDVGLRLVVSPVAVVVAVVVGMAVILVAAHIPARRAARCSAIEAIRQTRDIVISPRSVKTSRLMAKLTGLTGVLARKNFKRNKRRYRTTVISLVVSVVLFVAASSFGMYIKKSGDLVLNVHDYDIMVSLGAAVPEDQALQIYDELAAAAAVDRSSYWMEARATVSLSADLLSDRFIAEMVDMGFVPGDDWVFGVWMILIADADFASYLADLGWAGPIRPGDRLPTTAVYHGYDRKRDRWVSYDMLRDSGATPSLPIEKDGRFAVDLPVKTVDRTPPGFSLSDQQSLMIFAPYSWLDDYAEHLELDTGLTMVFWSDQAGRAETEIRRILNASGLDGYTITSSAEEEQQQRNILLVVNTFTYGFIILMALITVANVFNTISTNVQLRRRELAMLTSVGMSRRGMRRMMLYECAFYGLKALVWGLPIAVVITYLIYRAVLSGVDVDFTLPWAGLGISVAGVFLVVLVTMVYAISKVNKANTVDVLTSDIL